MAKNSISLWLQYVAVTHVYHDDGYDSEMYMFCWGHSTECTHWPSVSLAHQEFGGGLAVEADGSNYLLMTFIPPR